LQHAVQIDSKHTQACQEFKIEARKMNISLGRIATDKTVADQDDAASTRSSSILRANRTYGFSRADNNDDAISTRSFATMRSVRSPAGPSVDPAGDGTSTVSCAWTRSGGGISTILHPIFVRYLASALQQGAKDHSGLLSPKYSGAQAMLMEGLARCLLDNPRTQDLVLRTQPSLILGLGEVMRLKKLDAFGWVCMSLSQVIHIYDISLDSFHNGNKFNVFSSVSVCLCVHSWNSWRCGAQMQRSKSRK
jgi:hypothetical protein